MERKEQPGGEPEREQSAGSRPAFFHYNRQERLSLASAPRRPAAGGGGFFRRNRTLLLIFVDLLIVMILGLFLVRFLYTRTYRAELSGYSLQLRGFHYGEVVFATLTVGAAATQESVPAGERERIFVRFALTRSPAEESATYASALLPAAGEEDLVLRVTMPAQGAQDVLYAEVRIGSDQRRLSRQLER